MQITFKADRAEELLSKYVSKYHEGLRRTMYRGGMGYATDGRIAIRIGASGALPKGDKRIMDEIDMFMSGFAGANPIPSCFYEKLHRGYLKAMFDKEVDEAVADAKRELYAVVNSKCPNCGKELRIDPNSGDMISYEQWQDMKEDTERKNAARNVSMPIRFIVEPESDGAEAVGIILVYRYARMLAYAVGEDGGNVKALRERVAAIKRIRRRMRRRR